MKLSVLPEVVRGKRLVLIDDSIVRGTTIAGLITLLKRPVPLVFMCESALLPFVSLLLRNRRSE